MKCKNILLGLFLIIPSIIHATHTTERKIYATDITNKSGTTTFRIPLALPTSDRAAIFNSDSQITSSSITGTELNYLSGVTSSVQSQLNGKLSSTPPGSSTNIIYNDSGSYGADSNNTWDKTNKVNTVTKTSLGTTPSGGLLLRNSTSASNNSQQVSPRLELEGQGWKTNSTAGSQPVKVSYYLLPIQGAANPSLEWKFGYSINNGAYSYPLSLFSTSSASQPLLKFSGIGEISVDGSNFAPATVDHLTLTNPSGGTTHLSYKFGSTVKAAISVGSSGDMSFRSTSSYTFNIGGSIGSQSLIAQIYSGGIYNNGGSFNQGKLTAGASNTNAPGTLNSFGSVSFRGRYVDSNYTATSADFALYCDTTNSSTCQGTPTACSTYTNSSTCDSHSAIGCGWQTLGSCSSYSGTDSSTCTGANAICSWETSSCSAYDNDSVGCTSAGFPSGGQCSFSPRSCSEFFDENNPGACPTGEGCSANYSGDCSAFTTISGCDTKSSLGCTTNTSSCGDYTDEFSCTSDTTGDCSWNGSSCDGTRLSSCTGSYYSSCDGSYSGSQGTCSGSFDTGNCVGGDYGLCGGTAACGNLSVGSCTSEGGCSVVSGLEVILPSIAGVSDSLNSPNNAIALQIKKINSGSGNVTVKRNTSTSDTIQGSTSVTLSSQWSSLILHAFTTPGNCSEFDNSSSSCNANSGCSFTAKICGDFNSELLCNAQSGNGCTWNSGVEACEGTYTGSEGSCSGSYAKARTWMKWATQ